MERSKAYIRLFGEWLVTFMPIFQIIEENARKPSMKAIRKKSCSVLPKKTLLMIPQSY